MCVFVCVLCFPFRLIFKQQAAGFDEMKDAQQHKIKSHI